jgi:hypothetical protein
LTIKGCLSSDSSSRSLRTDWMLFLVMILNSRGCTLSSTFPSSRKPVYSFEITLCRPSRILPSPISTALRTVPCLGLRLALPQCYLSFFTCIACSSVKTDSGRVLSQIDIHPCDWETRKTYALKFYFAGPYLQASPWIC